MAGPFERFAASSTSAQRMMTEIGTDCCLTYPKPVLWGDSPESVCEVRNSWNHHQDTKINASPFARMTGLMNCKLPALKESPSLLSCFRPAVLVWLWIKIVVALWFSPTNIAPQPIPLRSASRTLGKVQSFTKRTSSKIEIGSHGPFSSMIYLSKNGGSFHSEVFTKGSAWGWPGWRKIPWISMMFSIGVFLVNLHNHSYQLFQCELEMPLVFLPDAAQKI